MIDFSKYPLPKRWRHHVQANLYFPFNEKNPNLSEYPPLIDKLDWSGYFHNGKPPSCLDIGSAWSAFLLNYACLNPSDNILGIEIRKQTIEYSKDIIENEKVGNAAVLWYSVVNGLGFIEEGSIEKIFYFFPDPWFKQNHKKRRAFNSDFLENCFRALKSGGKLYLQTDIEDVNTYQKALLGDFGKFDTRAPSDHRNGIEEWKLPRTNKEEDCIKKGLQYWRIICEKP